MIFDEKLNFKGQEKLFSKQTLLILIYIIKIFLLPFSELKNPFQSEVISEKPGQINRKFPLRKTL